MADLGVEQRECPVPQHRTVPAGVIGVGARPVFRWPAAPNDFFSPLLVFSR